MSITLTINRIIEENMYSFLLFLKAKTNEYIIYIMFRITKVIKNIITDFLPNSNLYISEYDI